MNELTTADLKQAERMVLAYDAQDPLLIQCFEEGKDVHGLTGCQMYRGWTQNHLPPDDLLTSIEKKCPGCADLPDKECAHSERQLSKSFGYATAYKMGPIKMVRMLRRQGVFMAVSEAKRLMALIVSPAIVAWQRRLEAHLMKTRWYKNHYGRPREFYGLIDDELVRDLLSDACQSFVADNVARAMIKVDDDERVWTMKETRKGARWRLVTQTHDSLTMCHPVEDREDVKALLVHAFNNPVEIHGRPLTIPLDFKHGERWS
jgi:DNA polymerase I-like protein with 3'-5' exonuclease and polymerase domains